MQQFTFLKKEIFESVKTESSLFAARQFTDTGDPLFKQLVFDEQYKDVVPLFKDLFYAAQADILDIMPSSLLVSGECCFSDAAGPEDFVFGLNIDCSGGSYNVEYFKVITIKVKEALTAYIMYRWLETKMPKAAETYLNRFNKLLEEIKKNVRRRNGIGQVRPFM